MKDATVEMALKAAQSTHKRNKIGHFSSLWYRDKEYSVFICWNKKELLFLMKYMRAIQVRTSTKTTLSF